MKKHRHSAWYGVGIEWRGETKNHSSILKRPLLGLSRGALIYSELRYIPGRPLAPECDTLYKITTLPGAPPVQKSFSSFSPCFETDNAHGVVATIQLRIRARYENTPRAHIVETIKKIVCLIYCVCLQNSYDREEQIEWRYENSFVITQQLLIKPSSHIQFPPKLEYQKGWLIFPSKGGFLPQLQLSHLLNQVRILTSWDSGTHQSVKLPSR